MKRSTYLAGVLLVAILVAACTPQTVEVVPATSTPFPTNTPVPEAEAEDIVDTAIEAGDFTTLVQAVQAAGLEDALRGEGPFTVFAPTDAAFDALPDGTLEALLADPTGQLQQILLYHVLEGQVQAADVTNGLTATTLQGADVSFAIDGSTVTINDATIVATDIMASNGVIHVIDAVILPPEEVAADLLDIVDTAIAAGDFDTLVQAVQAAGLEDALRGEGPFTVFAPTDAAFAALPDGTLEALLADPTGQLQQILLYHVLEGQVQAASVVDGLIASTLQGANASFAIDGNTVTINDATIVATDIMASNGVIHVIDAVILPPEEAAADLLDIVDTAIAAGDFTTLVQAVQAAGLEDALRGEGPFTVFAPTDAAFDALPDGTLEALLADPTGQLQQILLYHVLEGQVEAADVANGLIASTLQGADVSFTVEGSTVTINDVSIVATDILASNGVIHVIDAVILPPEEVAADLADIVDTAIAAGDFDTLVQALQLAGLEETLRGTGPFTVFAPTNAAFSALPSSTMAALLANPLGQLQQILLYHVIAGEVLAEDVTDGLVATTLQGDDVNFAVDGSAVTINDANITATDIRAANGVIHLIDRVLLPPAK